MANRVLFSVNSADLSAFVFEELLFIVFGNCLLTLGSGPSFLGSGFQLIAKLCLAESFSFRVLLLAILKTMIKEFCHKLRL